VKVDTDSVAGRTDPAARTEWRDGFTDPLSEGHEKAVELFPVSDRDDLPKSELGTSGCFRSDEPQTIGDSMDMSIDTDPILAITERGNKVGCFSSHSFQQEEIIYGVGHLSVVFPKNHSAEIFDPFGFDPVKSDRIDRSFNLLDGKL